jgi:dTDP-4-dehydrorhamnose 3,5-epimerase
VYGSRIGELFASRTCRASRVASLQIPNLENTGVVLFRPSRFEDVRGFVSESFRGDVFKSATGTDPIFPQENHLYSREANTIRGFHYQGAPHAQGKLVRVMKGSILDFALDIRTGSPTFGKLVQAELSLDNGHLLWLPAGFAHGFVTLEPETHVLNKLTDFYYPAFEGVVLWDDPHVNAPWPYEKGSAIISERDRRGVALKDLVSPFY